MDTDVVYIYLRWTYVRIFDALFLCMSDFLRGTRIGYLYNDQFSPYCIPPLSAWASTTCHDKIDGWDTGIEKHVGGMPLAPSSHFKITEQHRHNLYRCCS